MTAIYASDRAGNTSAAILSLAMITAALAYLVAVGSYLLPKIEQPGNAHNVPIAVSCLVPLPIVGLFAFFMIVWADTALRGGVLTAIEKALTPELSLPSAILPSSHRRTAAVNHISARTFRFGITFAFTAIVCPAMVLADLVGAIVVIVRGEPHSPFSWFCVGFSMTLYVVVTIAAGLCFRPPPETTIKDLGLPYVR